MKTIVCFLLSTLSLTFVTSWPLPSKNVLTSEEIDEIVALPLSLVGKQDNQRAAIDYEGEEDIAKLEGVLNVVEQVRIEKGKAMKSDRAMAQLWGTVIKGLLTAGQHLWNVGKHFLKKKYCTEEQEVNAILQELTDKQEATLQEGNIDPGDGEAIAELQSLFSILKKAKAKLLEDNMTSKNIAKAEGWWRKVKRWFQKKVRGFTKRFLC